MMHDLPIGSDMRIDGVNQPVHCVVDLSLSREYVTFDASDYPVNPESNVVCQLGVLVRLADMHRRVRPSQWTYEHVDRNSLPMDFLRNRTKVAENTFGTTRCEMSVLIMVQSSQQCRNALRRVSRLRTPR